MYQLDGGSVGVRCNDDTVSLTFASPNDGWSTEVLQSGPSVVDVRFERGRDVSELRVTCSDGRADPHIDESGR